MTPETATILGRIVAYRVRVSRRARSWRLTIHPDTGLTVVIPAARRFDPQVIIHAQASWILKHLDRTARHTGAPRTPLMDGSALAYLGGAMRLVVGPSSDRGPFVDYGHGTLRVTLRPGHSLAAAVETWYRGRAREVIGERLMAVNADLGYVFRRVAIRDQRTRWGSCSARGNLAFNWRLLLAPLPVIDYVVAHELVHLVDLSHSKTFWGRVAAIDPDYASHRRWLRNNGRHLALDDPTIPQRCAGPQAIRPVKHDEASLAHGGGLGLAALPS